MALRNLRRQARRSATALLAIGFGVTSLLVATGFNAAMFEEFREATIRSTFGHVQVSRPGFQERGRSDPWAYLLPAEMELPMDSLPEGARAAPRLLLSGLASHGEVTMPFVSEGIDAGLDMQDDRALRISDGRRLRGDDERAVLVGGGLAHQLGVDVGDLVVLLATTPDGQLGAAEAEVVGIFSSFSREFDDAALLMPIALSRELAGVRGAHSWLVFLERTEDTSRALAPLRAALPPDAYDVQPWYALAEFYNRASALFAQQLDLVKGIVIFIILLGIGNTMMMSVLERTGEIGTVMALGSRRSAVLRGFLMEGALLGLLGALLGVAVAIGIGQVLEILAIEMPPPPTFSRTYEAGLLLTPSMLLETVFIACATTTVAALYPAWRASRMVIVDAIRHAR